MRIVGQVPVEGKIPMSSSPYSCMTEVVGGIPEVVSGVGVGKKVNNCM